MSHWYLSLFLLFWSGLGFSETKPIFVSYSCKWKIVAANTSDTTEGVVIPNGETWALEEVNLSGADPSAYVSIVFDDGGAGEKIFLSTKGEVSLKNDTSVAVWQVTGDGSAEVVIKIINDNATQTPIIGGCAGWVKVS